MLKRIGKPFWYWGTAGSFLILAIAVVLVFGLLTQLLGLEWFNEEERTLFSLGILIAYILSLIAGGMVIMGVILFPKEVLK